MKRRLIPSALAPFTSDGSLDLTGLSAIIVRNAGTATVRLFNGLYTLDSKETLSLNITESDTVLDIPSVFVSFDTASGPVKRLEILTVKSC